jgi:hypothetical protein
MMTRRKNQFINTRGKIIDTDSDECPPGFGLRTSMMMLDGMQEAVRAHYMRQARITDAFGGPAGRHARSLFVASQLT